MDNSEQRKLFADELGTRFDELQQWAIERWPDKQHPLSPCDFSLARKAVSEVGLSPGEINHGEPEPSEGGAQYTSVTPAPWP